MITSLIREANGNVVLRSDNIALRFFTKYGAVPLEWWSEPFPLLTNSIPGAGASVAFDTGQDPTEASANGNTVNPVAILGDSTTAKYNYYLREKLVDSQGMYITEGFYPDFWLSAETADDSIAPDTVQSDSGWRTKYSPGAFAASLQAPGCPVIFQGGSFNPSGIFLVGNEMSVDPGWNQRLREYRKGRIAFKCVISLKDAHNSAIAGCLFRKAIPNFAGATKNDAFYADGYHLNVNRNGGWELLRKLAGVNKSLAHGKLNASERDRLLNYGTQVEVRTHNNIPGHIEVYFDDRIAATVKDDIPVLGSHFGLYASTPSGHIVFQDRRIWDVGISTEVAWKAYASAEIVSRVTIKAVDDVYPFYRANTPAIFLNPITFPFANRRCSTINKFGDVVDQEGVFLLRDYKSFYCGNNEGTVGILATPITISVNRQPSPGAHVLIQKKASNDEFVLMLNPLSMNTITQANEIMMETHWKTHL